MQHTHGLWEQVGSDFGVDALDDQTLVLGLAQHAWKAVNGQFFISHVLAEDVGVEPLDVVDESHRGVSIHLADALIDAVHRFKAVAGCLEDLLDLGVLGFVLTVDTLFNQCPLVRESLIECALGDSTCTRHVVHRHRWWTRAHEHLAAFRQNAFLYIHDMCLVDFFLSFEGAKLEKTFKTPKVFLVFSACAVSFYVSVTIVRVAPLSTPPSRLVKYFSLC